MRICAEIAMGLVQRLDDGNTLMAWAAGNPTVTKVAAGETKLYEMAFDTRQFLLHLTFGGQS